MRCLLLVCLVPGLLSSLVPLPPSLYPAAKCTDGSQANYHVLNYHDQGKIVIHLQGGAYCDSIESCTDRCDNTNLCTADKETLDEDDDGYSWTRGEDPFKDYTQVRVHYCSSDTWAGTREASDQTGGFYFYGKYIFDSVVEDLALNFNLLSATHVVLTGGSAGAQGVAHNCDHFHDWLKGHNPSMDVRCLLDSPEFYPPEVHTDDCSNREPGYQDYLSQFWAREEDKSCLQFAQDNSVENIGELCGVLARFLEFITTPLALLTSHEDAVFIAGMGCLANSPDHDQFREEWMAAHSELVLEYSAKFPEMSWFAPNCRTHVIMNHPDMAVMEEETGAMTDVFTFVTEWLTEDRQVVANDDIYTNNPTCN